VFYAFVVLVPSARGAWYAFTDWDGLSPDWGFVGFEQFRRLVEDEAATGAVVNTLLIAVTITVVQNLIGLLLALGVNSRIKSRNVLRVLLFAPAVVTPVATGYLWQYLLSPDGAVNQALRGMGLGLLAQDWLGDPDLVVWVVAGVIVWQFSGVLHGDLPGRPAGRAGRRAGGRGDGRRRVPAHVLAHHPADAGAGDHHQPDAVDHRWAQTLRPGVGDDRRWPR
jgi:hypothetical protein